MCWVAFENARACGFHVFIPAASAARLWSLAHQGYLGCFWLWPCQRETELQVANMALSSSVSPSKSTDIWDRYTNAIVTNQQAWRRLRSSLWLDISLPALLRTSWIWQVGSLQILELPVEKEYLTAMLKGWFSSKGGMLLEVSRSTRYNIHQIRASNSGSMLVIFCCNAKHMHQTKWLVMDIVCPSVFQFAWWNPCSIW